MVGQSYKLVLFKNVPFADGASLYSYESELQSNGGCGSDTAGLTHSHSGQPVTVRYATSTGS